MSDYIFIACMVCAAIGLFSKMGRTTTELTRREATQTIIGASFWLAGASFWLAVLLGIGLCIVWRDLNNTQQALSRLEKRPAAVMSEADRRLLAALRAEREEQRRMQERADRGQLPPLGGMGVKR